MPQTIVSRRAVRFGVFEVDLRARELRKNGVLLRLQGQPFQILTLLLERPGEMVTREKLRQKLWPADTFVDFDNSVNAAVNRLRETLGDSADNPRFVQTLPRRGYRFIAPVESVDSEGEKPVAEAAPDEPSQPQESQEQRSFSKWKSWTTGIAVGAILLAAGGYVWKLRGRQQQTVAKIRSIAVLPLANLTGDSSQEFFSDGMTDALITNLAEIHALRVISRTSMMQYKGTQKLLPQIGRELHVDAVLEGTVIRSGDRVRIDTQLIEAATDRHLWAGSYERNLEDVLALQAEVAGNVVREIQIQVTPQEDAQLAAARPVNKEAYEEYLRGRFFWNKRTEAGIQKSIEYFENALKKDPNYAQALSGISDAYSLLGFYGTIPPQQAYPQAKTAASNALRMDGNLAEAHVSLAEVSFWFDWNWSDAETEFKRAIELNPGYDTAYRKYSNFLVARGRVSEALVAARKALELDPLSPTLGTHLGWFMFLGGQADQAIEQLRKTIELDPYYARAHRDLAVALARQGNYPEAIREGQRAIELSESTPIMLEALGYAYARAGRKADTTEILGQLEQQRAHRYVSPFYEAIIYGAAGQKDRAFDWLERAYGERSPQLAWLKVYPPADELRSDPRFEQLLRRVDSGSQAP
jgi:TolB-like protein/DNA-binding winged helix-turn-helix (wHTH) protein/Flp pilus assembly protein TadD